MNDRPASWVGLSTALLGVSELLFRGVGVGVEPGRRGVRGSLWHTVES